MNRSKVDFLSLKYFIVFFIVFTATIISVRATHIRAGEITIRRMEPQSLTFEFTFSGYRDTEARVQFGDGVFNFGDGNTVLINESITRKFAVPGSEKVEKVIFVITHTYEAPNTYLVSYEEPNRNDNISNMNNSVNTPFYVESQLIIDPFFGLNNSPILTVPPVDYGVVGGRFIHNPGAYDPDGDSLSYRFTTPKQGRGRVVINYQQLNDPVFYSNFQKGNEATTGPPTLSLNGLTGDMIWDAPGDDIRIDKGTPNESSEYNVAFVVEEWRMVAGVWYRMGYVTRDMQIIINNSDNEKPTLNVPDDICVEAEQKVELDITATDPDGDDILIQGFGGPFEVGGSSATIGTPLFQKSPATAHFEWQTECGHVRKRPYTVQFKATDNGIPRLVDLKNFDITVVGPAPTGVSVQKTKNRQMFIEWNQYACENADKMEVWRRVGSFELDFDTCVVGMPANSGYRKIAVVPLWTEDKQPVTDFLDDNKGKRLTPGVKYCYRLVALYPLPGGGVSYVSEEICDSLLIDAPVITNVDVTNTGFTDGEITVRWTPPYQIDQSLYPPVYSYDLLRGQGKEASNKYTVVKSRTQDTVFHDTGINTDEYVYNYFVRLYSGNGNLVDSSGTASSVELNFRPKLKSIQLNWTAEVPWSNTVEKYPYHYIYRDQVLEGAESRMVLIDSVDVTKYGYTYLDNGRFNDHALEDKQEYCYYVKTQGSYGSKLLPEPLINHSQIGCTLPRDSIPPCKPLEIQIVNRLNCDAILANQPCGNNIFPQRLEWKTDLGDVCGDDLDHFNVYYSFSGLESDYELIGQSTEEFFVHNTTSLKGCYKVSAVDQSLNESEFTEEICNDNCPVYKLPNVFTPNNDGVNDFFTPLYQTSGNVGEIGNTDCPRFINRIKFYVFNRAGDEIYFYDSFDKASGIYIDWNGKNKWGIDVPSGVYFYQVVAEVDVLDPKASIKKYKGWIQILREN